MKQISSEGLPIYSVTPGDGKLGGHYCHARGCDSRSPFSTTLDEVF